MINFIKKYENIQAFFLYLLLITIFYAPVVFFGKSLQPSLYQPHGVVEGWPYGYKGRVPVNTFNIDLATPSYYEWPINKLVGDIYKKGELPLWNPYQGAGTPLAAQYSTRVFFPYQILEDISPVWTWDYFLLGRVLIAGFFTYLFLNLLGLSFRSAFLGGMFYMFSGAFTWFINLEEFTNNAMMVPVFLYCIERLVQRGDGRSLAFSGISFGLVFLAGQPEMALYVLFLGACYYAFRTFLSSKGWSIVKKFTKFVLASILGLTLAVPQILPFVEFMRYSHHIHPSGGDMGTRDPLSWERALGFFTPTSHELFQDPDYHLMARGKTPSGEVVYFRSFPRNGEWDFLGGYSGIIPIFLILTGLLISILKGYNRWRPHLLFFSSFGMAIVLKHFGVKPFLYLGYLPLFDQVWSQRWAGPTWTFSFAVAGAIGYNIVKDYFSGEIPPPLNGSETVERTNNIRRIYANNLIKYPLLHALAAWISLLFAYNSFREWTRHIVGIPIKKDVRLTILAIKATFPWAIITFVLIYFIITLWKNRKIGFLSFRQYGVVLAIQALLVNFLFYSSGKSTLIVQNLALLYLAFILLLWGVVIRFTFIDTLQPMREGRRTNIELPRILNNLSIWIKKHNFPIMVSFFAIFGIYLYLISVSFRRYKYIESSFTMRPYFVPSVVIGTCISIILLIIATVICVYYVRTRKGLYGLIPLVILELWWAIPRGYSQDWLLLKVIPLIIGFFVVLMIVLERWRFALFGIMLFLIAFAWLDSKSPNGFPDRYNPFTPAPYVDFLKKQEVYCRVIGGYGVLFPNFAGAIGIQDIRYINALSIAAYQEFREKYLHLDNLTRWNSSILWFTGRPELFIDKNGIDCLGYRRIEEDIRAKLPYYSLMGVRYILMPVSNDINQRTFGRADLIFPLLYNREIKIYENPYALPRAFVAYEIKYAPTYQEAQKTLSTLNFNLRCQVVMEEEAPEGYKNTKPRNENTKVEIVEYSSNRVVINISTEHPGILVLTDVFYPGWKAYVDGKNTKIYRINGLVRGVFINGGEHRIVFDYFPKSFALGVIFSLISLLIMGLLFL